MIEKMLLDKKHCRKCGRRMYSTESQEEGICAFCYRKSTAKRTVKEVLPISQDNLAIRK